MRLISTVRWSLLMAFCGRSSAFGRSDPPKSAMAAGRWRVPVQALRTNAGLGGRRPPGPSSLALLARLLPGRGLVGGRALGGGALVAVLAAHGHLAGRAAGRRLRGAGLVGALAAQELRRAVAKLGLQLLHARLELLGEDVDALLHLLAHLLHGVDRLGEDLLVDLGDLLLG